MAAASMRRRPEEEPPEFGRAPSMNRAASFLRGIARMGSSTERSGGQGKGIISSLLHAVGIGGKDTGAEGGPDGLGRGCGSNSSNPPLARLSSVAHTPHAPLGQFDGLRNDSFSKSSAVKLLKRPSMAGGGEASAHGAGASPIRLVRKSGSGAMGLGQGHGNHKSLDLGRISPSGGPGPRPWDPAAVTSPSGIAAAVSSPAAHSGPGPAGGDYLVPLPRISGSGAAPRGAAPPGPGPGALPHMGRGPGGVGQSPKRGQSRPGSAERLPTMSSGGAPQLPAAPPPLMHSPSGRLIAQPQPQRDRPPTPRGRASSSSGMGLGVGPGSQSGSHASPSRLAAVLGSFRLPDIMTGSSKSVTDRPDRRQSHLNVSVSGNSASGSPRVGGPGGSEQHDPSPTAHSWRQSQSGSPHVRGSGNSFLQTGIASGPGAAAILASVNKRAAAGGGGAAVGSPAVGSPLAAGVAASGGSVSGRVPGGGGASERSGRLSSGGKPAAGAGSILTDFQSSLELDEEGYALAAVEAEFDRRFGRAAMGVPGAVGSSDAIPQVPSPAAQQQQQQQQQQHQQPMRQTSNGISALNGAPVVPSPPHQPAPLGAGGRRSTLGDGLGPPRHRPSLGALGGGVGPVSVAAGTGGAGASGGHSRPLTLGWGEEGGDEDDDSGRVPGEDSGPRNAHAKSRLASIRQSCADGLVGLPSGPGVLPPVGGGASGGRPPPAGVLSSGQNALPPLPSLAAERSSGAGNPSPRGTQSGAAGSGPVPRVSLRGDVAF